MNLQHQPAPVTPGAERRSGRLEEGRRPSRKRGRPDQRPDTSQVGSSPFGPPQTRHGERASERAEQQRHHTPPRIRTIDQQTQHGGTVTARGWFDSMLRAAGRQMVRGVAFGRGGQTTQPKRRKHDSSHQENPGDAIVAVHTHASPTVLHL
jgi:hypothetical protein